MVTVMRIKNNLNENSHRYFQAFHRLRIDIAVLTLLECLFLKRVVSSRRRRMFSGLFFWAYQMSVV